MKLHLSAEDCEKLRQESRVEAERKLKKAYAGLREVVFGKGGGRQWGGVDAIDDLIARVQQSHDRRLLQLVNRVSKRASSEGGNRGQ